MIADLSTGTLRAMLAATRSIATWQGVRRLRTRIVCELWLRTIEARLELEGRQ